MLQVKEFGADLSQIGSYALVHDECLCPAIIEIVQIVLRHGHGTDWDGYGTDFHSTQVAGQKLGAVRKANHDSVF